MRSKAANNKTSHEYIIYLSMLSMVLLAWLFKLAHVYKEGQVNTIDRYIKFSFSLSKTGNLNDRWNMTVCKRNWSDRFRLVTGQLLSLQTVFSITCWSLINRHTRVIGLSAIIQTWSCQCIYKLSSKHCKANRAFLIGEDVTTWTSVVKGWAYFYT